VLYGTAVSHYSYTTNLLAGSFTISPNIQPLRSRTSSEGCTTGESTTLGFAHFCYCTKSTSCPRKTKQQAYHGHSPAAEGRSGSGVCSWVCLSVCICRRIVLDQVCTTHQQKKSGDQEEKSTYTRSYRDRIVHDMHEQSITPNTSAVFVASSSPEVLRPHHRTTTTEVVLEAEELAQEFSNKVCVSLVLSLQSPPLPASVPLCPNCHWRCRLPLAHHPITLLDTRDPMRYRTASSSIRHRIRACKRRRGRYHSAFGNKDSEVATTHA
jgi:hypothetical protein